jgi:hypothetical protein
MTTFHDMPAKDPARLSKEERGLRDKMEEMFKIFPEVIAMAPGAIPEEDIVVGVPIGDLRKIMALAMEQLMTKEMTP